MLLCKLLAEFARKAYGNNAGFRSSQLIGSLKMDNCYDHDCLRSTYIGGPLLSSLFHRK